MVVNFESITVEINKGLYPLIGVGSGRNVYDLNNGYVVKMARNKKGFVQNKAEYEIAQNNQATILARITAFSEDYKYIIMEKAERLQSFSQVWDHFHVRNNRELFQIKDFRELLSKNNLLPMDLCRKASWGLVDGRPVIIDFGFTKEVRKYYRPFLR